MLLTNLAILVLAGFTGYLTISKVPNTLHTPLMSGTNAIHGIVVLGGIIVLGLGVDGVLSKVLLVIAVAFGTINVVGGFLVTDRMLEMFKSKPQPRPVVAQDEAAVALATGIAASAPSNGGAAVAKGGGR
jgi:NAD(P) transhydrogenase subunit alpha